MKVTVDSEKDTILTETPRTKAALISELPWAKLYTKAMQNVLGSISTVIRKREITAPEPKMQKNAEKLRDQLQSANHTVGELSDDAGIIPVSLKK
jgi:hypothetical protein